MERLGYRAELDGIRALSVIAIMSFHDAIPVLKGGTEILSWFFVLSGFLITTLLLEEREKYATIDLGRFYLRRILRLFPSLYLMLFTFLVLSWTVVTIDKREFISAGLYFSNLHAIVFGSSSPQIFMEHTWSLAMEEHFYLAWPIVIMLLRRKRDALLFCYIAMAISLAVTFMHAANIWRSPYEILPIFGLEGFAMGGILAYQLRNPKLARLIDHRWVLSACLALGLANLMLIVDKDRIFTPFRHVVGNTIIAIILYHVVMHRDLFIGKVLRNKQLVYVGLLSYALYLWHFPVFEMLKAQRHPNIPTPVRHVLKFGISTLLAMFTYHVVEKPLMAVRSRLRSRKIPVTPSIGVRVEAS